MLPQMPATQSPAAPTAHAAHICKQQWPQNTQWLQCQAESGDPSGSGEESPTGSLNSILRQRGQKGKAIHAFPSAQNQP